MIDTQDRITWTFKNFRPSEFLCKCDALCRHEDLISRELVAALQKLRGIFGVPFAVNSGTRCVEYNTDVGGSMNSQHLNGLAADIKIPSGMSVFNMLQIAEQEIPEFANGGIGLYDTFIHFDIRGYKARWDRRRN